MKRLCLLLSLSLIGSSLCGMEQKQQPKAQEPINQPQQLAVAQTAQAPEVQITIVADDGSEHHMLESYAKASETIKQQIEDVGNQNIYLKNIKDAAHFNLLAPFFKFAFEIQSLKTLETNSELSKKLEQLQKELVKLNLLDLHQLILSCNYFDLQSILDEAIEILAEKLSEKERVSQCLVKGYYEIGQQNGQPIKLALDLNMAQMVAKKMLQKSAAKPWFLNKLCSNRQESYHIEWSNVTRNRALISLSVPRLLCKKSSFSLSKNILTKAIAFNAANGLFAHYSDNHQIILFDQNGNKIGAPFIGHATSFMEIHFSADGSLLASQSIDGVIKVWDVETRKELLNFTDGLRCITAPIYQKNAIMGLSPDGKKLAYFTISNSIKIVDVKTGITLHEIARQPLNRRNATAMLCFDATNSFMAYTTDDVNIINLKDFTKVTSFVTLLNRNSEQIYDMCFNSHGNAIAISHGTEIRVYDIKTQQVLFYKICKNSIEGKLFGYTPRKFKNICFNTDDSILIASDILQLGAGPGEELIHVWDLRTKQSICESFAFTTGIIHFNVFTLLDSQLITSSMRDGVALLKLADLKDKEFDACIKIPEHAAILLQAYDCASAGAPFNAQKYPGLAKIKVPDCLQVLLDQSFMPQSWGNWIMQQATPGLAIISPAAAALARAAYETYKK